MPVVTPADKHSTGGVGDKISLVVRLNQHEPSCAVRFSQRSHPLLDFTASSIGGIVRCGCADDERARPGPYRWHT